MLLEVNGSELERLTEVLRAGGFAIPYYRAVSAGRLAEILLQ
jgi:hypothetical protein